MSHSSEQILQAAIAIQTELSTLLDPETAAQFQAQLRLLLHQVRAGEANLLDLKEHLTELPSTRQWFLQHYPPQAATDTTRSNTQLDGNKAATPSELTYQCPDCKYTDEVPQAGMKPEPCPDHPNSELKPLKASPSNP
jgi:hypothetical protein